MVSEQGAREKKAVAATKEAVMRTQPETREQFLDELRGKLLAAYAEAYMTRGASKDNGEEVQRALKDGRAVCKQLKWAAEFLDRVQLWFAAGEPIVPQQLNGKLEKPAVLPLRKLENSP
jgi:hypothetical protein